MSRILIWAGPVLLVLLMIVGGFLAWVLSSNQGTRWLLVTAAHYLDGKAENVQGDILSGVSVGEFAINMPDLTVDIENFHLQANWRELLERRLHVQDLSAAKIAVALTSSDKPASDEPTEIPAIPVQVLLDRVALGQLDVTIDGAPLPVGVADLETSLALTNETAQLVLRSLAVSHEMANVDLSGDVTVADLHQPLP